MSDVPFGRLGFGAATLGNLYREITEDDANEVLAAAWDAGIRYFDTAPHYGLGLSERRLGAFLATKPRNQFVISTKVGRLIRPNPDGIGGVDTANDFVVPSDFTRVWDPSDAGIRSSLDESLERLGLDRVDVLFLHDPERYDLDRGLAEAVPALGALRDEKRVRAVGVGSMVTDALLASARTTDVDLLMIAGRYTLAEQPIVPDLLGVCRINGVGIVNASVFNSGLLANAVPSPNSRYDYGTVPENVSTRVRAIGSVCARHGVELPAAALQYTLRDPLVETVVIGASNAAQVRQNVDRATAPIPEDFWLELHAEGLVPA